MPLAAQTSTLGKVCYLRTATYRGRPWIGPAYQMSAIGDQAIRQDCQVAALGVLQPALWESP